VRNEFQSREFTIVHKDVGEIVEAFQRAASLSDVEAVCRWQCEALGFDRFIFAMRVPTQFADAQLLMINGYPDGWVEHYFAQGYAPHDPVMIHCAKHVVPVAWHALRAKGSGLAGQVMGEAGEHGLRDGVTAPVHSPQGEMGVLSFAVGRSPAESKDIVTQAAAHVQLLSAYVHETVRRVAGLSRLKAQSPLSAREEDCLRWAADGKTTWEIAQILHLSERTVNFHLNNAVQKLDARNRQHAVAKAALQGLVQPWPF
jgi:DNA-binding CsgD family transcriptional regulator